MQTIKTQCSHLMTDICSSLSSSKADSQHLLKCGHAGVAMGKMRDTSARLKVKGSGKVQLVRLGLVGLVLATVISALVNLCTFIPQSHPHLRIPAFYP